MVELQHTDVLLAAVDARMRSEVLDEAIRRARSLSLVREVRLLKVVGLVPRVMLPSIRPTARQADRSTARWSVGAPGVLAEGPQETARRTSNHHA